MSRFSRIRQGARLGAAQTRYVQWLQASATRPQRIGQGTARGPQTTIYLEPFGRSMPTATLAAAKVSNEARTIMSTAIGLRAVTTAPTGGGQRMPGFTPAKVVLFVRTGNGTVATSEITGLQYLKYTGSSYSHAFGRGTSTALEFEEFNEIKDDLLSGAPNRRVSYKAELFKQV